MFLIPISAAALVAGCTFSLLSHAYTKEEDAAAQDEFKEAYTRGYEAAKEEMRRQAAQAAKPAAAATPKGAAPATTAPLAAPKPILDIKETYSDAGHVEKIQQVPVTAQPLPDRPQGAPSVQASAATRSQPRRYSRGRAISRPAPSRAEHNKVPHHEDAHFDGEPPDMDRRCRNRRIWHTMPIQYLQRLPLCLPAMSC